MIETISYNKIGLRYNTELDDRYLLCRPFFSFLFFVRDGLVVVVSFIFLMFHDIHNYCGLNNIGKVKNN